MRCSHRRAHRHPREIHLHPLWLLHNSTMPLMLHFAHLERWHLSVLCWLYVSIMGFCFVSIWCVHRIYVKTFVFVVAEFGWIFFLGLCVCVVVVQIQHLVAYWKWRWNVHVVVFWWPVYFLGGDVVLERGYALVLVERSVAQQRAIFLLQGWGLVRWMQEFLAVDVVEHMLLFAACLGLLFPWCLGTESWCIEYYTSSTKISFLLDPPRLLSVFSSHRAMTSHIWKLVSMNIMYCFWRLGVPHYYLWAYENILMNIDFTKIYQFINIKTVLIP